MTLAAIVLAMAFGPGAAEAAPRSDFDSKTSEILFDVANEICRDPALAGAMLQVPAEYRPVYLPRIHLLLAIPGDIPSLKKKYGSLSGGGIGLVMTPNQVRSDFQEDLESEIKDALADKLGCPTRFIGAWLEWYRPRAEKLPKVVP